MNEIIVSGQMPVLALRGLVVFPKHTVHFDVAREKSIKALEAAMERDQLIFLVPQKSIIDDDPGAADLFPIDLLKGAEKGTPLDQESLTRARNAAKVLRQRPKTRIPDSSVEGAVLHRAIRPADDTADNVISVHACVTLTSRHLAIGVRHD